MTQAGPCVVKLGGSHALQPHLRFWLDAMADCAGRIVVVPGGGPFADTVRRAQPVMGFDDPAAHRMAILAMEQFGVALAALGASFVTAGTADEIGAALAAAKVPVWLPAHMALADRHLPQTWDLTSDSLAAWLAGRLRAPRLVMVKHTNGRGDDVDPLFGHYLSASGAACVFLAPGDHARLATLV